jgi:hypothetical protein
VVSQNDDAACNATYGVLCETTAVDHTCSELMTCCGDLSGGDQTTCTQIVASATDTLCSSVYDLYCNPAGSSGHTCDELQSCCDTLSGQTQSLCTQAVAAGSDAICGAFYTNFCM